jgi:glutaredoxin
MAHELIMYTRTLGCPFVTVAKKVLHDYGVPYREIFIDKDADAKARVMAWTGFASVPTLVVANSGDVLPNAPFDPLPSGRSPRGIDRGAIITEPNLEELPRWLLKHGFIDAIED